MHQPEAGTKEEVFIERLSQALGRSTVPDRQPAREDAGPPAFWREYKLENRSPLELFKETLEALTGKVAIVKDGRAASDQLKSWLQELAAFRRIVWDNPELKQHIDIAGLGAEVTWWNDGQTSPALIAAAAKADVGITWADYAVAYTGSLALFSDPLQGRSVSLLPPSHIAIMKQDAILPTMSSVIRHLSDRHGKNDLPAAVEFITGPSRTSDIEMDLSIGVHGPFRVWVIVIE